MKKIVATIGLCLFIAAVYGQKLTVKPNPTGDGPILSGVSIVDTYIGVGSNVKFEKRMPTYNVVNLRFSLRGDVSQYKYKAKTYKTSYPTSANLKDCPGAILHDAVGPLVGLNLKMTIVIRVKGKTYTHIATTNALAGVYHFRLTLDEYVQQQFVDAKNIVSITVEPVSASYFEGQLDRMEECQKRKENEKKAKAEAEKEAKGKQTAKKEDDFWNGGEERKLTIVPPEGKGTTDATGTTRNIAKTNADIKGKAVYDEDLAKTFALREYENLQYVGGGMRYNFNDVRWWIGDKDGNVIIPKNSYKYINYSEGLAVVKVDENIGIMDSKGNLSIVDKKIGTGEGKFSEGLLTAWSGAGYGFINKYGEWVIPPIYQSVSNFSEGLAKVSEDGINSGFIDKEGKVVIPFQYSGVSDFSDGLARLGDKADATEYKYIDKTGKVVLSLSKNTNWTNPGHFSEGLAFVLIKDGVGYTIYGVIDKTGNLVIPSITGSSGNPKFIDGIACLGQYTYIDKKGKKIYDSYHAGGVSYPANNGFALVMISHISLYAKHRYIDRNGTLYIHDLISNTFTRQN